MMANSITDEVSASSDRSLLIELGRRIRRRRLERNWTQAQLAEAAGLDRTTVGGLEREGSATLLSLVQVLRALEALSELANFLPDSGPSPLELARRRGKQRQRASGRRGGDQ